MKSGAALACIAAAPAATTKRITELAGIRKRGYNESRSLVCFVT
jgi:hypothetical protein